METFSPKKDESVIRHLLHLRVLRHNRRRCIILGTLSLSTRNAAHATRDHAPCSNDLEAMRSILRGFSCSFIKSLWTMVSMVIESWLFNASSTAGRCSRVISSSLFNAMIDSSKYLGKKSIKIHRTSNTFFYQNYFSCVGSKKTTSTVFFIVISLQFCS